MEETENGLTNAQYAVWLTGTAAEDCAEVNELYIKYTDDEEDTITNNTEICELMNGATENLVATFREVRFSGVDTTSLPWSALDERLTVNLERIDNDGEVPLGIKRPPGT